MARIFHEAVYLPLLKLGSSFNLAFDRDGDGIIDDEELEASSQPCTHTSERLARSA